MHAYTCILRYNWEEDYTALREDILWEEESCRWRG